MSEVVSFEGVWKTYAREIGQKSEPALRNVSFSLREGETLGLIGANGAGKSTSIRLLMDFIRPDQGAVVVFGQASIERSGRQWIGYLPEIASFPQNLTILHLLRFTGATNGLNTANIKSRGEHWLKELELWDARKQPLRTYSKGMQQRASFVLALLNDPRLLILDEPMSGLDPIGRARIVELILDLKKQGKAILFCSHILEDVGRLADRLTVLHKGEVRFDGPPKELTDGGTLEDGFLSAVGGGR